MEKHKWIIPVTLLMISLILLALYGCKSIIFKTDAFKTLPGILSGYLLIAILIEQFVEGFILRTESENVDKLSGEISDLKKKRSNLQNRIDNNILFSSNENFNRLNLSFQTDLARTNNQLISKESEIDGVKGERNNSFNQYAFFIGLILSSFGFKFFTNIVEAGTSYCSQESDFNFVYVLNGVDVFLTAILFAGGSKLILELLERYKNA